MSLKYQSDYSGCGNRAGRVKGRVRGAQNAKGPSANHPCNINIYGSHKHWARGYTSAHDSSRPTEASEEKGRRKGTREQKEKSRN